MLLVLIKQSHCTNLISSRLHHQKMQQVMKTNLYYIFIFQKIGLVTGSLDGELIDAVKPLVWALYGKSRQPDCKRCKRQQKRKERIYAGGVKMVDAI